MAQARGSVLTGSASLGHLNIWSFPEMMNMNISSQIESTFQGDKTTIVYRESDPALNSKWFHAYFGLSYLTRVLALKVRSVVSKVVLIPIVRRQSWCDNRANSFENSSQDCRFLSGYSITDEVRAMDPIQSWAVTILSPVGLLLGRCHDKSYDNGANRYGSLAIGFGSWNLRGGDDLEFSLVELEEDLYSLSIREQEKCRYFRDCLLAPHSGMCTCLVVKIVTSVKTLGQGRAGLLSWMNHQPSTLVVILSFLRRRCGSF
ncbi:hypothetical protein Tco_0058694 [Tanacetum coccineum]